MYAGTNGGLNQPSNAGCAAGLIRACASGNTVESTGMSKREHGSMACSIDSMRQMMGLHSLQ